MFHLKKYGKMQIRDVLKTSSKFSMIAVLFCFIWSFQVSADIYKFIDSNGVINFTNVPVSSNYKLYIREIPDKNLYEDDNAEFDSLIKKASQKFGVDFPLVKAIIKVESNFNSRAVSTSGARGLMQIMPENFKKLCISDPFNPYQNIMGGTQHIQQLLAHYNGKLPLALAAYNAGLGVVDRYRSIPPFRETIDYVNKVMKQYSNYNFKIGSRTK